MRILEGKVRKWRPEVVCLVGKGIWEAVYRVWTGKKRVSKGEIDYGWVGGRFARMGGDGAGEWEGSRIFVAASTSGQSASLLPAQKEAIWRELGHWVQSRRTEEEEARDGALRPEEEGSAAG